MTIQEKVKGMHVRMAEMRDRARTERQRSCFGLLHDAVVNTGPRIDELDAGALVGYIELAARAVNDSVPNARELRSRLTQLGFNTTPVN
jgi:hypothetical protein